MTPEPPLLASPVTPTSSDVEHLKLLMIFHFILAGLSLVGLAFLALQWTFMQSILLNPAMFKDAKGAPPPDFFLPFFRWFLFAMGIYSVGKGCGNALAGWFLLNRRGRLFCLIMAGFNCISFPMGTAVGVFTFIVLLRPSVVALYAHGRETR